MNTNVLHAARRFLLVIFLLAGAIAVVLPGAAASPQSQVELGTADAFAVLGGQSVTNTGASVINGDLGVSPGSSVTGFGPADPGIVNGTIHKTDAQAGQAQADLTTAYNDAAGRASDADLTGQDLGGLTKTEGVYSFDSSAQLTGTFTLDAQGNADAVFIIQIGTTLTTATDSVVSLINQADPCHVFWQVGSSATLGTTTRFVGNVMALTSITAVTGTTVNGSLLARNGSVTLDTNTITASPCAVPTTTTTPGGGGTTTSTTAGGGGTTTSTTAGGGGTTTSTTAGGGGTTTSVLQAAPTAAQAATTTTSTSTVASVLGSRSTAGPATSTGVISTGLPRTGGRTPLVGLALGLLLLTAGALALRSGSAGRPRD